MVVIPGKALCGGISEARKLLFQRGVFYPTRNHLEDVPAEKIELARKIIAKHCQKVRLTENQDRINPSNHASSE
jgi:hypothetical protein